MSPPPGSPPPRSAPPGQLLLGGFLLSSLLPEEEPRGRGGQVFQTDSQSPEAEGDADGGADVGADEELGEEAGKNIATLQLYCTQSCISTSSTYVRKKQNIFSGSSAQRRTPHPMDWTRCFPERRGRR